MDLYNTRQQLSAIAEWLGEQDESLSFGLKNSFDALRLYDYSQSHPDLPEMADEWTEANFIAAIGYNPFALPEAQNGREVTHTGAANAANALSLARTLLDSVAFISAEGDSQKVISAIDEALSPKTEKRPRPRQRA